MKPSELEALKVAYPVGCRVVATARFRAAFRLHSGSDGPVGTVVGYGRKPQHIQVLRDGIKNPVTYATELWDKIVGGPGT